MSMALIVPYGGFNSGSPCTLSANRGGPRDGSVGASWRRCVGWNSLRPPPAEEPEPPVVRGPVTALPSM